MNEIACEGPGCTKGIPMPTGDGSTVTRSDNQGGHYFCSEACAQNWESVPASETQELEGHDLEGHFPQGYVHTGGPSIKR